MSGPEAVSGTAPGRAAYEAYTAATGPRLAWERLADRHRQAWDAAALAATLAAPPAIIHIESELSETDIAELREKFAAAVRSGQPQVLHEPVTMPVVTVETLTAVLTDRDIPVRVGNGCELRKARNPRDLAVQLLSAIDTRLTDDPAPAAAPELAAAMAETRQLRDRLTALADSLKAEADEDEAARENTRDGISRLLLEQRAGWRRTMAAKLRAGLEG